MTKYDFEARKRLFEEIKKFSKTEQEELYRILVKHEEYISENKNGMYFDLMNLKDDTLHNIESFIVFCSENNKSFEQREKTMNDLRQQKIDEGEEIPA